MNSLDAKKSTPVFTEGALIQYMGDKDLECLTNEELLAHAEFLYVPKNTILVYLDSIKVSAETYYGEQGITTTMFNKVYRPVPLSLILAAVQTEKSDYKILFHRFLYGDKVIRVPGYKHTHLYSDFHYAKQNKE